MSREGANNPNYRHGGFGTRLYNIWVGMRQRCENPDDKAFADYGGRGISVCQEWQSFSAFKLWAKSSDYSEDLELDRYPDNNGNYGPSNCRWATRSQQLRNTRRSTSITAFGETKTIADWSEDYRCRVDHNTLRSRIRRGTLPETAITSTRIVANQYIRQED